MPIQIYAHRGLWANVADQNSINAHCAALEHGWGTELDIRDVHSEIVLQHDPSPETEITDLNLLTDLLDHVPADSHLAMNLKSSGLLHQVRSLMTHGHTKYFLFDLSGPEQWLATKMEMPFFIRLSPYERAVDFKDQAHGLVIDSLGDKSFLPWIQQNLASLKGHRSLFFISDEIHGLDSKKQWSWLREVANELPVQMALCTDLPEKAETFFGTVP